MAQRKKGTYCAHVIRASRNLLLGKCIASVTVIVSCKAHEMHLHCSQDRYRKLKKNMPTYALDIHMEPNSGQPLLGSFYHPVSAGVCR